MTARKVIVKTFKPPKGPMVITTRYGIPNPERMAKITVARLQLQLLGQGCQCHTVEELVGLLKDLGVEVEIQNTEGEKRNAAN